MTAALRLSLGPRRKNLFLDSTPLKKSNVQRKKGATPSPRSPHPSSSTLLQEAALVHSPARKYDKEIFLFSLPPPSPSARSARVRSEKNSASGSVEHVPGIGRRVSSDRRNSEESGARMYMRADVEIFLKGTAGQDAARGGG